MMICPSIFALCFGFLVGDSQSPAQDVLLHPDVHAEPVLAQHDQLDLQLKQLSQPCRTEYKPSSGWLLSTSLDCTSPTTYPTCKLCIKALPHLPVLHHMSTPSKVQGRVVLTPSIVSLQENSRLTVKVTGVWGAAKSKMAA